MKFEEKLVDLEGIVEALERGEIGLEEALKFFERGIALVRELNRDLDAAEQRIEVLTREGTVARVAVGGVDKEEDEEDENAN